MSGNSRFDLRQHLDTQCILHWLTHTNSAILCTSLSLVYINIASFASAYMKYALRLMNASGQQEINLLFLEQKGFEGYLRFRSYDLSQSQMRPQKSAKCILNHHHNSKSSTM